MLFLGFRLCWPLDIRRSAYKPLFLCPAQHGTQVTKLSQQRAILYPGSASFLDMRAAIGNCDPIASHRAEAILERLPSVFHRSQDRASLPVGDVSGPQLNDGFADGAR